MVSTSPDHISGEKMSEKQQQQLAVIAAKSLPPSRSSSKGSTLSKVSKSGGKWARLAKDSSSAPYTPKKTKQLPGRPALLAPEDSSSPMDIEVQPSSSTHPQTVHYTDPQSGQMMTGVLYTDPFPTPVKSTVAPQQSPLRESTFSHEFSKSPEAPERFTYSYTEVEELRVKIEEMKQKELEMAKRFDWHKKKMEEVQDKWRKLGGQIQGYLNEFKAQI